MKKIILGIAAVLTFTAGCNNGGSTDPKGVVMSFIDALSKKDIEGAKKYATKDSEAMLGMVQMTMSMIPDSAKDKMFDKNSMEYGEAVVTGDKAVVAVKDKKTGETTNYNLRKEDGAWKVAFTKADSMEKMKDKGMDKMNEMNKMNKMNNMTDSTENMQDQLKDTMRLYHKNTLIKKHPFWDAF